MFKSKIFKKKPKNKKEKDTASSNPDTKDIVYDDIPSVTPPVLPKTPIPKQPIKNATTRKIFSKDAIGDLPLQHVSSNRRMEDLDDDEYGYTTGGAIYNKQKKKKMGLEETFLDAQAFVPYRKESHNPMISRFFFSPKGYDYADMSVAKVCQEIDNLQGDDQQDLKKFITVHLLPSLKLDNKIADVFVLLSCKNKYVRSICIQELTEMILEIDHRRFSREDLMNLYETGTVQLFTAITETKKTFSIFQPLIQLGIMFNCFIYLKAVEAMDDWIACIRRVMNTMQSKTKRVMERSDPDVRVFAKTAQCIFDLENVDLDDSLLLGEDVDDFLPEFSREDGDIYIEGLAALFHTGNLILRQQSKLKAGVQKLVRMSSFMNGSNDDGMVKWSSCLLGQFVVRILQKEYHDVKQDVLDRCEDQICSILKSDSFQSDGFNFSHCLLFHHNDRVRSRYRDIAKTKGVQESKAATEIHIQTLLNKFGINFETSTPESKLNSILERKQCIFSDVEASITIIYEAFPMESADVNMYDNTQITKGPSSESQYRIENMENELEVLKEVESEDFHINVARLLAFNQSLPRFYIKERLPGDNLQRRLLEAREKGKIIPIVDLIRIIIQAVKAVIYVHNQGCLLRDITTASYGCTVSDDGYFLKLKNFEMAARPSDLPDGGIISGVIDMDFKGVPIRWAAPESLLGGHYSIFSDVWSVNILADEILNYAAWPYSDISDADINDMVTHIVFTHLKPQGFNRPRRVQGLILEGLATVPEQRLKLEALRERLLEILDNIDGGDSYSLYDTYSGVEGSRTKTYDIPPLTERQKQANSVYERGIPASIKKYRELEDPITAFSLEVAEHNSRLKEQTGLELIEISSDDNYKIESEDKMNKIKVMERVTDDFLKFTYNKLNEIDSSKMCVEPWPPSKSGSADGYKLHYSFPRSTRLLDVVLHKDRGETIGPYIELLYELANHVDSFHSAGWIFRCLRAKNVWILESQKRQQSIVVPKFGKYRMIVSSEFDAHLEQIKVDSREEMEGVQWLPIEAIKAGLYSKESDVYAFGMVTWEVMTAFGQEGVVYDQDEERELSCIPFNYQQSENILQHLIEGYIPEKPIKCPDWFYQEVTRPCLLHQKIDRPSMKTVLQILQTRLRKTLPRQILSLPPSVSPELYDVYEDADILYEDDYEGWGDVYTGPNSSDDEESIKPVEDDKANSSVVKRKPPPPPQINMDKKDFHADGRRRPPPPLPPLPQKPSKIASDMADCSLPPVPRRDRDTSNPQESKDDKGYKTCPSVLKRLPVVLREKEEDSANPSDVNSCKSLPLPITPPPQSNENKEEDQDVYASQINPISPQQQTKDALNSAKKLPLPPKPPKPSKLNSTDANPKIDLGKDESSNTTALPVSPRNIPQKHDEKSSKPLSVSPNENQSASCGPKTKTDRSNSSDSVYKGSDFHGTVQSVMSDDMRETFKGSDFNSSDNMSIGLGDTHKGSDFNSSNNLGDTHKGSDIDRTVRPAKDKSIGTESTSAIKTKPKVFPKPKAKPKSPFYVNDQELKADDVSTPVYVNQNQPGTKPAVPPRKPLNK